MDSTLVELPANCMDWARHRRRKTAAKMHLRLDLHGFRPSFAIVATAGQHDNRRARELCTGLPAGEIVLFDKAYVDFVHLCELTGNIGTRPFAADWDGDGDLDLVGGIIWCRHFGSYAAGRSTADHAQSRVNPSISAATIRRPDRRG